MKVERILIERMGVELARQRAIDYLKRAGYDKVDDGPPLVFLRGSLIGTLRSPAPRDWRCRLTLDIEPRGDKTFIKAVFDVSNLGQWVGQSALANWEIEADALLRALKGTATFGHRPAAPARPRRSLSDRLLLLTVGLLTLVSVLWLVSVFLRSWGG